MNQQYTSFIQKIMTKAKSESKATSDLSAALDKAVTIFGASNLAKSLAEQKVRA